MNDITMHDCREFLYSVEGIRKEAEKAKAAAESKLQEIESESQQYLEYLKTRTNGKLFRLDSNDPTEYVVQGKRGRSGGLVLKQVVRQAAPVLVD